MRAMILAAGLGTRLRPLTDDRPKALVEVAGRTLLEITLARLRSFGITDVIVNVHHFADLVVSYLKKNSGFGMRIEISHEEVLLDTGGGLKQARWFFLQTPDEPFLLHNVDVISAIDIPRMIQAQQKKGALAILAVQHRDSSRQLLFDENNELCGRRMRDREPEVARPSKESRERAFSGIHVISPRMLPMMTETGAFSIIETYLRLAAQGERITAFPADEYYWRDLGKPENVAQAAQDVAQKVVSLGTPRT